MVKISVLSRWECCFRPSYLTIFGDITRVLSKYMYVQMLGVAFFMSSIFIPCPTVGLVGRWWQNLVVHFTFFLDSRKTIAYNSWPLLLPTPPKEVELYVLSFFFFVCKFYREFWCIAKMRYTWLKIHAGHFYFLFNNSSCYSWVYSNLGPWTQ